MRQRAAILVIAIAGLASAATGASPPPPPDVVGEAAGEILLTPEQPISTVELVVRGNPVAESTTSFRVAPEAIVSADSGASGASSVLFQVIPRDDAAAAGPFPWVDEFFNPLPVDCTAGGPCEGRFTLRAFLTDPSEHAQRVTWRATAETRNPSGVAAAPDAVLTVEAAEPVAMAPEAMASATTAFDRVTVSRDHPRSVHTVRFTAPFGPRSGDLPGGSLLRIDATASDGDQTAPFRVFFGTPPDRPYEMPIHGPTLYDPFHACVEGAPCEGEYQVIFEWSGGPLEREATIEANLSAWLPRPEATPADAVLDLSVVTAEPEALRPVGHATLSGVFELDAEDTGDGVVVDAVLDQSAVPQGVAVTGVAMATLRIQVTATDAEVADPSARDAGVIDLRLGQEGANDATTGQLPFVTGATQAIGSPPIDVDCQGRSRCVLSFVAGAGARFRDAGTVRIEWELEVDLTLADGAQLDPAATFSLEVRPDP